MNELDQLLERMPAIAKAVNAFSSPEVQLKAFDALIRVGSMRTDREVPDSGDRNVVQSPPKVPKRGAVDGETKAAAAKKPQGQSPKMDKDLNLRLAGKTSWRDFVAQKAPRSQADLSLCAVYWLTEIAELTPVSVDMVFTCFRDDGSKKQPANFRNHLQVMASKNATLNTKKMDDIKLTPRGTNLVEHDLPPTK